MGVVPATCRRRAALICALRSPSRASAWQSALALVKPGNLLPQRVLPHLHGAIGRSAGGRRATALSGSPGVFGAAPVIILAQAYAYCLTHAPGMAQSALPPRHVLISSSSGASNDAAHSRSCSGAMVNTGSSGQAVARCRPGHQLLQRRVHEMRAAGAAQRAGLNSSVRSSPSKSPLPFPRVTYSSRTHPALQTMPPIRAAAPARW